ncbi:glycosyltransferase [Roseovarius salis]|uniref:glycosyltransferase n=1 Tax=Roseovarius salis TaxID=3376063 RepID=UPI0037C7E462
MYSKLIWAFKLYSLQHLEISLAPHRIVDSDEALVGNAEELRLREGRLHVRGWCIGDRVELRLDEAHVTRTPSIERSDVAAATGADLMTGFEASLPFTHGKLEITVHRGDDVAMLEIEMPRPGAIAWARRRLFGRFLFDLVRGAGFIIGGYKAGEIEFRRRIKSVLRLEARERTKEIDPAVLVPAPDTPAQPPACGTVTVVLPVFNAFELLCENLDRLIAHTDLPWRLILIEDSSTDTRVRPWLRDWAGRAQAEMLAGVELIENEANLGFIGSVNRGLARARELGGPVVLLNSDALVPRGWASRLMAPLVADDTVATVTPMSNDAEIFGAPVICTPVPLAEGQLERMDRRAASLSARAAPVTAPTGVGFCMAMSPAYLDRVPQFDTAFGRGYGEEVDWCRKTAALGGRHLAATNLFVEHRGGESFGSDSKRDLVIENNRIISGRYPDYDGLVQQFIMNDPLVTERLALAVAYLDSLPDASEVPVFIAHAMGGGAENYLQDRIARMAPRAALILRFGGSHRCRIEAVTPAGVTQAATDDLDVVKTLVADLDRRRVVYSCAVGDPDAAALPGFMAAIARERPLDILFHDYLPISPSYTLLGSDMVFRGVPDPATDDPAHMLRRPDGTRLSLQEWQTTWHGLLEEADRLIVFSDDSKRQVAAAYPDLAGQIVVEPHQPTPGVATVTPPRGDRKVIGVLGNIGPQKGIGVLRALSHRIADEPDLSMVVVGRVDPRTPLHQGATVHGPYTPSDIPALVERYGITCWLIPSIWPETFSFTTRECLATGLPVITFDLGAQGDAASRAENGIVVPLPREGAETDAVMNEIMARARSVRS